MSSKQDFIINEIETHLFEPLHVIIRYTNYKKLLIKYDKDFNDTAIKSHCERNNIEFGYTR